MNAVSAMMSAMSVTSNKFLALMAAANVWVLFAKYQKVINNKLVEFFYTYLLICIIFPGGAAQLASISLSTSLIIVIAIRVSN
jgi:hypothetical protein